MTEKERVARAIAKARLGHKKGDYTHYARAAIAASQTHRAEAGLVVVPREPTGAVEILINEAILEEKSAGYIYRIGIEAAEKETTEQEK